MIPEPALPWARWPWNRCRAVREPRTAGELWGRCELARHEAGTHHALDRGAVICRWSTAWTG